MKIKLTTLLFLLASALGFAQTITNPVPVDSKWSLYWDDPNPASSVASWNVYAKSLADVTAPVRMVNVRALSVSFDVLLDSSPQGMYSCWNAPVSGAGTEGQVSTNFVVLYYPKLKGGQNLHVGH